MVKKVTTLTLDSELVELAKKMNLNISAICNEALRKALIGGELSENEIRLAMLRSRLDYLREQKGILEQQLRRINREIENLGNYVKRVEKELDEELKAKKAAALFRELNSIIVNCDFDIERVKAAASHIIKQLQELDRLPDEEALAKHIESLRMFSGVYG